VTNAPVCETGAPTTNDKLEEQHFLTPSPRRPATIKAPWGPWSPAIDAGERRCQLRCLSGLIAAYRGTRDPLIDILRDAELDRDVLQHAAVQFDQLPSLVARRIVSTFGAVNYRRRGR
jgi:hypothetical protein